jgi:hypothetical protein
MKTATAEPAQRDEAGLPRAVEGRPELRLGKPVMD